MRRKRSAVTRWFSGLILMLMILASTGTGCLHTRGAMFLGKGRVGEHLEKTRGQRPPEGVDFETYITWRQRLSEMPDGNRILGGFCSDNSVEPVLQAIDGLRPQCQKRLFQDASSANLQGRLFWGFLGTTIGTGAAAFAFGGGAFAVSDATAKTVLGVTSAVLGTSALLAALINGFGGFDARQERHKIEANRIDNFMWSLRQRVIVEVCNAKDRATAVQQIVYIYKMTQQYCSRSDSGDGIYVIPPVGPNFDSQSLPSAPVPETRPLEPDKRPDPTKKQDPTAPQNGTKQPTSAPKTPGTNPPPSPGVSTPPAR